MAEMVPEREFLLFRADQILTIVLMQFFSRRK